MLMQIPAPVCSGVTLKEAQAAAAITLSALGQQWQWVFQPAGFKSQSLPLPEPLGRTISTLQHSHTKTQKTNCSDSTQYLKLSTQAVEGAMSFVPTAKPPAQGEGKFYCSNSTEQVLLL